MWRAPASRGLRSEARTACCPGPRLHQCSKRRRLSGLLCGGGWQASRSWLLRNSWRKAHQQSRALTILLVQLRRGLAARVPLLHLEDAVEGCRVGDVPRQLKHAGARGCHRHGGGDGGGCDGGNRGRAPRAAASIPPRVPARGAGQRQARGGPHTRRLRVGAGESSVPVALGVIQRLANARVYRMDGSDAEWRHVWRSAALGGGRCRRHRESAREPLQRQCSLTSIQVTSSTAEVQVQARWPPFSRLWSGHRTLPPPLLRPRGRRRRRLQLRAELAARSVPLASACTPAALRPCGRCGPS